MICALRCVGSAQRMHHKGSARRTAGPCRYYEAKFGLPAEDQAGLVADLRRNYVEGLCWVMAYYFDGVASWRWFYRYHYAPFASDLHGMAQEKARL
jgi:5'-3' exonuclease